MYYCDHCGKLTPGYHYKEVYGGPAEKELSVKREKIKVTYDPIICTHCAHEVWTEEAEMDAIRKAVTEYRQRFHLLEPKELAALMEKMGAETLAKRAKCSVSELKNSCGGGVHSYKTDMALRKVMLSACVA